MSTPFYRLAVVLLLTAGCKTTRLPSSFKPVAASTDTGILNCFVAGTTLQGETVWCEASAVAFDGRNLLFANDKDMPAQLSPVFAKTPATLADSTQAPTYLMQPAYAAGRKYEDFAQTPDRKFVLLTTAFDRTKPGSSDWDGYNTILYWPTGHEQQPHVLAPDDTSRTSIAYRTKLARALATSEFPEGAPYFKVEGLAATDQQLLFGIREVGESFKRFKPVDKIVAVSYTVENTATGARIRLNDDWRVIADFDPAQTEPTLPKPLSLSSLEYDPGRHCFWLLTSIETSSQLDAYLWYCTPADLLANKPFSLVRDAQGQPLRFGHKAEDLTILDKNRLLIIHDDDRFQLPVGSKTRQPNQAPYTIVTLK
ncbi:hypothetical protein [Spirosoma utsteinense]|uniref:Uncharacterized protein n=1 Tax=Spirosoma utsteinense TaxID=2585773 RepID=A0ABR6W4C6_9BACT|nr:hypothetical protein [Spirosoma utsteinense]MBC3786404.1 hypothetical protein [Spirosoma utsteinense]MBC3791453.1 hypothetical protein [Spirosoma utsteinense]